MKILASVLLIFCAATALGLTDQDLKQITFEQNVGRQVSRDISFQTSAGEQVTMGTCFDGGKPVILVLGYDRCPMLCTFVNDGLIKALQDLRLSPGKDFKIVNVSIDPAETPQSAAMRRAQYVRQYGRKTAAEGWTFLVGQQPAIEQLAREVGFHYAYDKESGEFAHPSGIVIITPSGRISRYLLGVNYDAAELLQALQGAGREERGSVVQQLALLCFHYNPVTGKYSLAILNIVRVAGLFTVLAIAVVIFLIIRRRPVPAQS